MTLTDIYAEDGMTLDQLMAFSVGPDHERQEQVWEAIQRSHNKEPYQIRRLLTEGAVRASDKRAQYAGDDYAAVGGPVMRDLFQHDDGGWLQDVGLLERLVGEKLERDAEAVRTEGWKWVEVGTDFPYGHTYGLRLITGAQSPLTDEEEATVAALRAEAEQIEETYAETEELPEEADLRLGEIETALAAIVGRPTVYDPADITRAGAFVSIDGSGLLRIERGYVRPEDELPIAESETVDQDGDNGPIDTPPIESAMSPSGSITVQSEPAEDDEGIRSLPDKLLTELTAYRTLALRDAVGNDPSIAFLAVLHVLCLKLFCRYGFDTCLEIEPKSVIFGSLAPGLADTPLAARVDARHRDWAEKLPAEPSALWDTLAEFDGNTQAALFAHCVSLTINAVHEAWNRRPKAIAHADRLAEAVSLDLATAGWSPTVDNFFGRVTKAGILDAVREAKGEAQAQRIDHLKKGDMAAEAEQLLAGSGWLPEPLRTPNRTPSTGGVEQTDEDAEATVAKSAATDGETAIDPTTDEANTTDQPADAHTIAAE